MPSICCQPEVLYLGLFSISCVPPLCPCGWEGAILRRKSGGNMAWQGLWKCLEQVQCDRGIRRHWCISQREKRNWPKGVFAFQAEWSPWEQSSSLQAVTEISAQTFCQYLHRTYLGYLALKPHCPQAELVREGLFQLSQKWLQQRLWWHYNQELCYSQRCWRWWKYEKEM